MREARFSETPKKLSAQDKARLAGNELDKVFSLMGGEHKIPAPQRERMIKDVVERYGLDSEDGKQALLADTERRISHSGRELGRINRQLWQTRVRYVSALIRKVLRL